MPIYEYRCKACGHEVEALQKVSDAPLKKCPECGRRTLARLMSAPSFRLKGGGWYETDFKSDSEKKRNLVDSGDGGSKDGGDSGKDSDAGKSDANDKAKEPAAAAKTESTSGGSAAKSETKATAKGSSKPAKSSKPASKKARHGATK